MSKIVSYKKDALGPRCHMKLDSGERILIHSEASTSPSATDPLWLTITTLKLGGLVPGESFFRVDQRSAAAKARIAQLPAVARATADKPTTIDAVIDLLRDAPTVAEVRKRLSDAFGDSAPA